MPKTENDENVDPSDSEFEDDLVEKDDDGNCYIPQRLLEESDDDDFGNESENESCGSEQTTNQKETIDNDSTPDLDELVKLLENCGPAAKQSIGKIWPSRCDGPEM